MAGSQIRHNGKQQSQVDKESDVKCADADDEVRPGTATQNETRHDNGFASGEEAAFDRDGQGSA